jgi:alpha-beta hydrolase superfamily lysophospholipase
VNLKSSLRRFPGALPGLVLLSAVLTGLVGCGSGEIPVWNSQQLSNEYSAGHSQGIDSFRAYLALEEKVFTQLDEQIYSATGRGPHFALARYSAGSISDPRQRQPDWNRSFELTREVPSAGALLLHGMTDSPYSLRALGQTLHQRGYQVVGLRLPGHGTAPSGMTRVSWQDMSAAVELAMTHLGNRVGDKPIHIIGYSTGAALALDYALQLEQGRPSPPATSLVLISPAIGISPAAALAKWKRRLGLLPGLAGMAWLQIEPEFDPYKYNSFATNAAEQVHALTSSVASRIAARNQPGKMLPPILVLKSTVDATVSNDAVVDRLLMHLAPNRHQLVLFDINRFAANASLLVDDPGPFTTRLIEDQQLPFGFTLVANEDSGSRSVKAYYKAPYSGKLSRSEALDLAWPDGVFSLSHVALPFPPDDPLYGRYPPTNPHELFLGQQAFQGERGVLKIPGDFLLRLRHNPFYDYLESRVLNWLENPAGS